MIKVTYDITLTESQFGALKDMVKEHYERREICSVDESNIYDLFKVINYTDGPDVK